MQRHILNLHRGPLGNFATRIGAVLAMTGLLLLTACEGRGVTVTDNNLAEPGGPDGVAPALTKVTIKNTRTANPKPNDTAKLGQSVRIDIQASESIRAPKVTIMGDDVLVRGAADTWWAIHELTGDTDGEVTFLITYQDISGEVGLIVTSTTDGSAVLYCVEGCPDAGGGSLAGDWRLDGEGSVGVGPEPLNTDWFNNSPAFDAGIDVRPCWFDDVYRFGADGSFQNIHGDDTWIEAWQGGSDACGAPVAPHDGSTVGTWVYDEEAGTLTITGTGNYLGLPKVVNGEELASPAAAPDSVTYNVEVLDGDSLTVSIQTSADPIVWWTYRLARQPVSPLVGKWKLDGEGSAGVGPEPLNTEWFNNSPAFDAGIDARPCWFDDVYEFNADGSFRNIDGGETWVEAWQGGTDACGPPVAPHDGSNGAIFEYDEDASTLKLTGRGAYLGLAKVVNGEELASPAAAPESVTYTVEVLDGNSLTVSIQTSADPIVWWTYRLTRVSNSPLIGKWKLAGEGSVGVGPEPLNTDWFNNSPAFDAGIDVRPCWFDDIYYFGDDGSFRNFHGDDTWVEAWQGGSDACGTPVAPHDGANAGSYSYDEDAGTLVLNGVGSYLGLPKVVNGGELASPAAAPDSVTYNVEVLDGDSLTVSIQTSADPIVWWTYVLERVNDTAALAGKWKLDGEGSAGVGPEPLNTEWFNNSPAFDAGIDARPCWFDDAYEFNADGSFRNIDGGETWVEVWQGGTDACGPSVAPHDGSNSAIFEYDEDASTLKLTGRGAYLGLAKVVNDEELASPAAAPDSITYTVEVLDGDSLTVSIQTSADPIVWWTYRLTRVSNSPLAGNWKLAGEGSAGVGPEPLNTEWFNNSPAFDAGIDVRPCWFDDIYHFGADGSFQNFQDGETWVEAWQGGSDACGTPVAPHDGSTAGSFSYDEDAGTLVLNGVGSYLGLPKVVNGGELASPAAAPDSITYNVEVLDGESLTVSIQTSADPIVWWTYTLAKD